MAKIAFKGSPISTNGELPKVGSKIPHFTLVDLELNNRSLSDFKGKRILISVNPSLDTSVCLATTKKFNDIAKHHSEVVFLIVSGDLPFAQKRICGLEKIENVVPLSMMRSKDFAKDLGILIKDGPLAGLPARCVFIVDEEGKIIYNELVSEITHEPHYENALQILTGETKRPIT